MNSKDLQKILLSQRQNSDTPREIYRDLNSGIGLTLKSRKALSLQIEQTNYENKMSSTSIRIIDSKKQKFIFSYGDIKCPLEGTFGLNGPNSPLF